MTVKMKTPITQNNWQRLKKGDTIKDRKEAIWTVTKRDPDGNPNRLFACCKGCPEDRLDWHNNQIIDKEGTVVSELNHPSVVLVKTTTR